MESRHALPTFYNNKNDKEDRGNIEDRVFPSTFLILKLAGIWRPSGLKRGLFYTGYQFYTLFCITSMLSLLTSVLLVKILPNYELSFSLMEYWYILVIWFTALLKVTNLFVNRKQILHILRNNIMEDRWRIARDVAEKLILKKSQNSEKTVMKIWSSLIFINGVSSACYPIIAENSENLLLFKSYSPCDRRVPRCFWICYLHQICGYAIISSVHLGFDILIFSLILRITAHLRIMQHRLARLPLFAREDAGARAEGAARELIYLKERIRDQQSIYKTINEVNDVFYVIVAMQYFLSISVLCTNVYFLSKQEMFTTDFFAVFAFLCCSFAQSFLYCWYGHYISKTNYETGDTLFYMDWTVLRMETKRLLFFMMISASQELSLFTSTLVDLSPQMFLKIIKVSYSAFNLLQQS